MSLLKVQDISMQFGGLRALDNVSLSVDEGQIYSLIGPNGAGKSTLFNVISGFLVPTEGKVIYRDQEVQGKPPHKLTELGISRTFQNIRLLAGTTVLENVRLGHHLRCKQSLLDAQLRTKRYKTEEADSIRDAIEVLEFVGLGHVIDEKADSLPYGLQRKLEIARVIATGAQLLMFDEPCAGMNSAEKVALADLIIQINRDLKRTVFLIEHDMRFVMNLSENITVLNQGQMIAHGSPEQIQTNQKVIEAYLGAERKGGRRRAGN